mmetsp:Transcript_4677/g.14822  ORF Transcript_4677/g.14822 Transcript_4677/m.14822 type:complete len:542 (-) Transcript_4677:65-1690(-)
MIMRPLRTSERRRAAAGRGHGAPENDADSDTRDENAGQTPTTTQAQTPTRSGDSSSSRSPRSRSAGGGGGGGARITPQQIIAEQARQNAAFVEEEHRRMGKMKQKQDKELQQMISFEVKMQEVQAEKDRRAASDRDKEEKQKRAAARRAKAAAEEGRLKELQRAAADEAEELRRQAGARDEFERERQFRLDGDRKAVQLKREARARDEDRLRKAEEHRLATQRILAGQQAAVKRRMEDMELAERERQALVARKRDEERQRLELRRVQMDARIERNMAQAARVEAKRKDHFFEKEAHHEALRQTHLEALARERALTAHQGELQEQRRVMVLNQAKRDEEQRKEDLLGRFELEEENVRRVKDARGRDHDVSRAKQHLRAQMKLENVERIRRIGEYRRLEYLRKIHEADRRTGEMIDRKDALVQTRKQNALQIKIQKDGLLAVMEAARSSGAKASKLMKDVASLDRPSSADRKNKTKGGSTGLRSQSAQQLQLQAGSNGISSAALGPPPELPGHKGQRHAPTQLPYVSPYDDDPAARASHTVTF